MPIFNPERKTKKPKEGLEGLYKEIKDGEGKVTGYELKDSVIKVLEGGDLAVENQKLKDKIKTDKEVKVKETPPKEKEVIQEEPKEPVKTKEDSTKDLEMIKTKKQIEALTHSIKKLEEEKKEIATKSLVEKKERLVVDAIKERSGSEELLKSHVMKMTDLDTDGTLFVKDKKGEPRFEGSQKFKVGDLLEEMIANEVFSPAFKIDKKGMGTNTIDKATGKKISSPKEFDIATASPQEEIEFIKKYGKEAYNESTLLQAKKETALITGEYAKQSYETSKI